MEVTNNKRLHSRYYTVEATYSGHKALRSQSETVELLVY